MIRYKTSKLFGNFNFEKGFIMEETKKIGAKLEKLEISSRVIDAINKKSILRTLWLRVRKLKQALILTKKKLDSVC